MVTTTTLITGAFPGIYCGALPGMCWAADSRRILLDTAQRSQQVRGCWDTRGAWLGQGCTGLCSHAPRMCSWWTRQQAPQLR